MSALAETIAIQGRVLRHVLGLDLAPALARLAGARRVWLVGTGTSEHAACLGAAMLATAGLDARACSAASFVAAAPPLGPDDALIVISHTTETAFARRAREDALAADTRLVTITAEGKGWPEAIEAAPPERSETYTASYLAALLALARLASALAARGGPRRTWRRSPAWSTTPASSRCRSRRRRAASPSSSAPARRRSPPARER